MPISRNATSGRKSRTTSSACFPIVRDAHFVPGERQQHRETLRGILVVVGHDNASSHITGPWLPLPRELLWRAAIVAKPQAPRSGSSVRSSLLRRIPKVAPRERRCADVPRVSESPTLPHDASSKPEPDTDPETGQGRLAGRHHGRRRGVYFAQDVLIPVAMALFLALLLTPAVDRLQSWGMRRGFAVTIVMWWCCAAEPRPSMPPGRPATQWLARAPQTMRQIDPRLQPLREMFDRVDAVAERAGQLTQGGSVGIGKTRHRHAGGRRKHGDLLHQVISRSADGHPADLVLPAGRPATARAHGRVPVRQRGQRAHAAAHRGDPQRGRPLFRHGGADQHRPWNLHRAGHVRARHAERHSLGRAGRVVQLRALPRSHRRVLHPVGRRAGDLRKPGRGTGGARRVPRACI